MKSNNVRTRWYAGLITVALVLPALSIAETTQSKGWFVEAAVVEVNSSAKLSEFTIDSDDSGLGFSVGYAFSPHFEVQASYSDMGEHAATDCPPPRLCIIANIDTVDFDAFTVTAQGKWPIKEYLDIYAKAGVTRWDADFTEFDRDDSGSDVVLGAGVGIRLARNWRLDLQYSQVNLDLETYGLGLQYRF